MAECGVGDGGGGGHGGGVGGVQCPTGKMGDVLGRARRQRFLWVLGAPLTPGAGRQPAAKELAQCRASPVFPRWLPSAVREFALHLRPFVLPQTAWMR